MKFKALFSLKNYRGSSLVTVMVAAGIGTVVAAGMSSMLVNMYKGQKVMEHRIGADSLQNTLGDLLTEPIICGNNLAGRAFGAVNQTTPFVDGALPVANTVYEVGAAAALYEGRSLRILDWDLIQISVISAVPNIVQGSLSLRLERQGNITGAKQIVRAIQIRATIVGGVINSCQAVGPDGGNLIWDINAPHAYNINTGNIGIGTNVPGSKLTVQGTTALNGNVVVGTVATPRTLTVNRDLTVTRNITVNAAGRVTAPRHCVGANCRTNFASQTCPVGQMMRGISASGAIQCAAGGSGRCRVCIQGWDHDSCTGNTSTRCSAYSTGAQMWSNRIQISGDMGCARVSIQCN